MDQNMLTVGEVAALTGVTVRTLHHYDAVGLVRPAARTAAGYRHYAPDDVARLQEVVAHRRLGFALHEIPGPTADRRAALVRQRELVAAKIAELTDLERALDAALARHDEEHDMTEQQDTASADRPAVALSDAEVRELFGAEHAERFDDDAAEAEQRWGDSDAWAESARRTRGYTKQDWAAVRAEADEVNGLILAAFESGERPTSDAAMDAAEAARAHIDERFYPCSPAMHRSLGEMYVADPRFARTYDALAAGLAAYLRDAIHANADRQESTVT